MIHDESHKNGRKESDVDEWGKNLALRLNSIDIINSLHNKGLLRNPEKIAQSGAKELSGINGINRDSLRIIASLLYEFGYIIDAQEWLGDKSKKQKCPHCGH